MNARGLKICTNVPGTKAWMLYRNPAVRTWFPCINSYLYVSISRVMLIVFSDCSCRGRKTVEKMGMRNHIVRLAVYFQNHLALWRDNGGVGCRVYPSLIIWTTAKRTQGAIWNGQCGHNAGAGWVQLLHAEIGVNSTYVFCCSGSPTDLIKETFDRTCTFPMTLGQCAPHT
jgi:hypothetical protein